MPTLRLILAVCCLASIVSACGDSAGRPPGTARDAGSAPMDMGFSCTDSDGDTICDADEGTNDTDGDGTLDYLDADSDNDAVLDRDEAGDADPSTPPRDSNADGIPDFADRNTPGRDAGVMDDASGDANSDSGSIYGLDSGEGGTIVEDLCPAASIVPTGCMSALDERAASLCNQLDDDCDGLIDEGCECVAGTVQRCFRGPPGRRNVGACQDGQQTCRSLGEFGGEWGPCEGGIPPSEETCDDLDNDCNGCTDEVIGCVPVGSCPGPDDPRVPEGRPFSEYALRGGDFHSGDAMSWQWTVDGTPCDDMFRAIPGSTATSDNGQLSYQLIGGNTRDATLRFTLSGDYTITLRVTHADGSVFTCTWIVKVRGPGLRVELCWDKTGPTSASNTVDLDLHLGKLGTTTAWFGTQDCDYLRCQLDRTIFLPPFVIPRVSWGYGTSPIANCTGPGARGPYTSSCPNPRLDIDNVNQRTTYVPENINLDNPRNGDTFRVMVHHYTDVTRVAHPLVNIYCGGELKATFGAAPNLVEGLDEGGDRCEGDLTECGDMWRVADVRMVIGSAGTACDITPLYPPGMTRGYWITTDDPTY